MAITAKPSPGVAPAHALLRVRVDGKFFYSGDEKIWLRGVTYGTFRPERDGSGYGAPADVVSDFAAMRASGINAVRTYTAPPRWFLDAAAAHDLRVLVGLAWETHVAFLDERSRPAAIEKSVRDGVRACASHPAVFAYAVGNEIPASIVRWHGKRRVERFLHRLYRAAKEEDPQAHVTYVNYPSTEYLQLPFLDFLCFNVYLESEGDFAAYVARLQNLAGDRPLVMGEIGFDGRRNGEESQAIVLEWQVRTAFASGCAGAFVFAWTDEWHRGGYEVDDWDFGLTDRERRPKPALHAVRRAFEDAPFSLREWPRISVVVCSHNGAATIAECLDGVARLEYPNYEVIVVDDGSTDATAAIAERYDVRLIRTQNRGLSAARNAGLAAATGEIVAYIDDDAWPDPDWLTYLAVAFTTTPHAGIGGPNVPPREARLVADCVAHAPGGPIHVLVSDREAEHIPGCNSAFRKECLEAIGGFDPQFRIAGDDVDVCWRLQERGWTLGFSPAALVWHRPRGSIRAFFRQQREYGKAEALLERKWPERYNGGGHLTWEGTVYGGPVARRIAGRWRVYYGLWGSGLFQSVYDRASGTLASLPLMPEWYLVLAGLAAVSLYELAAEPLVRVPLLGVSLVFVLLLLSAAPVCAHAVAAAWRAHPGGSTSARSLLARRGLTALLHMLQPLARLMGRVGNGLTPWRTGSIGRLASPWPRQVSVWSETPVALAARLEAVESRARADGAVVRRASAFDRWDLTIQAARFGGVRVRAALEEHGHGKQLFRARVWPYVSRAALVPAAILAAVCLVAFLGGSWLAAALGAAAVVLLLVQTLREAAAATATVLDAVEPAREADLRPDRPRERRDGGHDIARALEGRLPGVGRPSPMGEEQANS